MSGFDDIERALKKTAEQAYKERATDMQRMFDRLGRELKDQPLDVAKSRLQREWSRDGGSITDPELTEYATALVEGRRIVLDVQPIRW
jgi:hypothetical protein